jgi:polysaccharide deacetylase 2 family uncharacterized protein YibQ
MPARKKSPPKKKSRQGRRPGGWLRAGWIILVVAALVVITGTGILSWSRTDAGRARLLRLGADRFRDPVQRAVGEAVAEVLPAYRDVAVAADPEADDPLACDWPLPDAGTGAIILCRVVQAPAGQSLWEVQAALAEALEPRGAEILWGERLTRPNGRWSSGQPTGEAADLLRLDLGVSGSATHTLIIHPEPTDMPRLRWGADIEHERASDLLGPLDRPTVAIIIDDWGNAQNETTRGLLKLNEALTLSILPGLPYSRQYALKATDLALPAAAAAVGPTADASRERLARGCPVTLSLTRRRSGEPPRRRREVMLHLPMEPQGYPGINPGKAFIRVGMGRDEMETLVDESLAALPGVTGVNNHMGSAATADRATMERLMDVLESRDLFFLDSMTTSRSTAAEVAREAGLATLTSRLFLDQANRDREQVRTLLARLVRAARATGGVVGICHPYPETLAVLAEELPRYRRDGIRFVTASELLALQRERAGEKR